MKGIGATLLAALAGSASVEAGVHRFVRSGIQFEH